MTKYEKISIGLAIAALVLTIVGLVATNIWTSRQLDIQRSEFELSRGALQVHAEVAIRDPVNGFTTGFEQPDAYRGKTLSRADFMNEVYARLDIRNDGTAATEITNAGYIVNDRKELTWGWMGCDGPDPCVFPLRLEPQSIVRIYVRIPFGPMHCSDYVEEHGIVVGVRTVDNSLLEGKTGTKVSFSNDCPESAQPSSPPDD